MTADALWIRATREHADHERTLVRAERALERIRQAAERIRHMTELYRERLDGGHVRKP